MRTDHIAFTQLDGDQLPQKRDGRSRASSEVFVYTGVESMIARKSSSAAASEFGAQLRFAGRRSGRKNRRGPPKFRVR